MKSQVLCNGRDTFTVIPDLLNGDLKSIRSKSFCFPESEDSQTLEKIVKQKRENCQMSENNLESDV